MQLLFLHHGTHRLHVAATGAEPFAAAFCVTVHRTSLRRPFEIMDRGKALATRVGAFDGACTLHVRVVAHDVHAGNRNLVIWDRPRFPITLRSKTVVCPRLFSGGRDAEIVDCAAGQRLHHFAASYSKPNASPART